MKTNRDPDQELLNNACLNNNRLCAIAIKTSGKDPQHSEILELCFLPLNANYSVAKTILPFFSDMKPVKNTFNISSTNALIRPEQLEHIILHGQDPGVLLDLFEGWFKKFIAIDGKKLMPIAYNWPWIRPFLINWFGLVNFNAYFSDYYRDILPITLFANDWAEVHVEQPPYPKSILSFIANIEKVEFKRYDDTITHANAVVEIYKKMLKNFIGDLI